MDSEARKELIATVRHAIAACCPPVTLYDPLPLDAKALVNYVNAAPGLLEVLETRGIPEDIRAKVIKHVERCDDIFDGRRGDGTQSPNKGDTEFAYNMIRHFVFELLEVIEGLR